MINSVEIDLMAFEASQKEAEKVIEKIGQTPARKIMIEAGTEGLISALRKRCHKVDFVTLLQRSLVRSL